MELVKIIREHTLYERLILDLLWIVVSKDKKVIPEYPFDEASPIFTKVLEYKDKAMKYDQLMASKKVST